MNAVITTNHFCEVHGPQVLFCTQTFHDPAPFNPDGQQQDVSGSGKKRRFYGNLELLRGIPGLIPSCEACRSLDPKISGLLSSDHDSMTSYLSGQNPIIPAVCNLAKHACLRSLSCEISKESKDDPEKPVFFGDSDRGHVLSMAFSIKDAQGRGFQRNYSICVLALDAFMLLQSWPFLTKHLQTVIIELQELAAIIYNQEQEACPQRALRINASSKSEETKCNKTARSLAELTGDPLIFYQLHNWFVWLLKAGANRLQEKLTLPPFLKNLNSIDAGIETEEGFVLVPTSSSLTLAGDTADHRGVQELEASGGSSSYSLLGPSMPGGISELYSLMGRNQFLLAAYFLLIGHQLVVQCEWPSLSCAIIQSFKCIVTRALFKPQLWSNTYHHPTDCNLLGVSRSVKLPSPLPSNAVLIDVTMAEPGGKVVGPNLKFTIKAAKPPAKWPTLLVKIDKALQNSFLTPTALLCHFVALKEEWLNISRTVIRLNQTGKSSSDLAPLLTTLGAQNYDWQLIRHWGVLHSQHN